ncbi:hypothetical protein Patl1_26228 [Pistacia atlantica]|uniref:Uncharacterized protein n=1 Tax=Pistacia atlantica TaxID=434234 RepID=A0ACC1AZI3_9ROSI|nr:hypothetical protein Patl1_26228 [Pistacia atlantica]
MGNLPEEELEKSSLAAKLNNYVAKLCPPNVQKIDVKINDIIRKGWPILREVKRVSAIRTSHQHTLQFTISVTFLTLEKLLYCLVFETSATDSPLFSLHPNQN